MSFNQEQFQKQAKRDELANQKLFARIKRAKPKDLDTQVHRLHDEAFEKIDCLECANCCKTTSPIFYQTDIERVAQSLRMKPGAFIEKYLHLDEDGDYVLNSAPCPFLDAENYCLVYADRPKACREYPHTDRKRVYQIADLTMRNTMVCPAVLYIADKLRNIYPQ
ncbi:MAG: YkgJ family cysteine cluster protein [Bacteroidetes bacterium]|nr:YkgJ family cysteine cluster protein [Bacteroidota bacterium]